MNKHAFLYLYTGCSKTSKISFSINITLLIKINDFCIHSFVELSLLHLC